jgi:hypothetical protein
MTSLASLAGRVLDAGSELAVDSVQIYRNLHHGKGHSCLTTGLLGTPGLVLESWTHAVLESAGILRQVQEGARKTVLATGQELSTPMPRTLRAWDKNTAEAPALVHLILVQPHRWARLTRASHDPTPVHGAAYMWFDRRRA